MLIDPTNDQYIVQTVKEDLEYLIKEWTQDIDDQSLRRSSGTLRRLLVEDALGKAWRITGFKKEPLIKSFGLGDLISSVGLYRITFAQAGGAKLKGVQVATLFEIKGPQTYNKHCDTIPIEYRLSQFVESICMVIDGQSIRRREIINYVSNKLGGVHTDTQRDMSKTSRKNQKEKVYILLDSIFKSWVIIDKNAVFYELLSIGQSLISSKDIIAFFTNKNF